MLNFRSLCEIQCDVDGCLSAVTWSYLIRPHEVAPEISLPDGWVRLGFRTYCGKHKVKLVVDDDPVTLW